MEPFGSISYVRYTRVVTAALAANGRHSFMTSLHPRLIHISFTTSPSPRTSGLHSSCPSCIQQNVGSILPTRYVCHVRVAGQGLRNLPACLNLSDLDQAVAALCDGLGDGVGTLGLTLCADNVGLSLLFGLLDDEAGTLGILLGDLLLLDGLGELLTKGHVGDGDVLEGDVELGGALDQVVADPLGDGLTLGDELGGVELGDDGLEDLVTDGREHTLVVVLTEGLKGGRGERSYPC